jgi:hypothetical protein
MTLNVTFKQAFDDFEDNIQQVSGSSGAAVVQTVNFHMSKKWSWKR